MHPDFSCRLRPTRVSVIGGEECHKSLLNNAFQVKRIGQFESKNEAQSQISASSETSTRRSSPHTSSAG